MPLVAAGQPTADSDAGPTREWLVPFPVDVPLTLSVHRHGGGDPAYATDAAGAVWRTSLTPDGPGTLRVRSRGAVVTAQAWGPGADWLLDRLPAQLGFHDYRTGFTACHPVVGELALRYEGLRVGCGGRVFEALVPAVLEQKVVGREAHRAWRFLLGKYGEAAPGPAPAGMRVVPSPRTRPRRTAAFGPCPASGPGPRPKSGSGPWATPTRSRWATIISRTRWAGRWPAGKPTTPACSSSSRPTPGTAI